MLGSLNQGTRSTLQGTKSFPFLKPRNCFLHPSHRWVRAELGSIPDLKPAEMKGEAW